MLSRYVVKMKREFDYFASAVVNLSMNIALLLSCSCRYELLQDLNDDI